MNPTPQSVRVITLNLRAGKLHGFNVAGRAGCQGLGFRVEGGFKEDRVPICVLLHHGGFDGVLHVYGEFHGAVIVTRRSLLHPKP